MLEVCKKGQLPAIFLSGLTPSEDFQTQAFVMYSDDSQVCLRFNSKRAASSRALTYQKGSWRRAGKLSTEGAGFYCVYEKLE